MGRRSRQRSAAAPPRAVAPNPLDERPRAPWHPFPLVELSVLVGIVLIVLGLFVAEGDRGRILLVLGLALGSLGGLDTALREHFSGFRSHSMLIAGVPAVLAAGVLFFAGAPQIAVLLGTLAVFSLVLTWARSAFRNRSGAR
jgi:hypothetical protein